MGASVLILSMHKSCFMVFLSAENHKVYVRLNKPENVSMRWAKKGNTTALQILKGICIYSI